MIARLHHGGACWTVARLLLVGFGGSSAAYSLPFRHYSRTRYYSPNRVLFSSKSEVEESRLLAKEEDARIKRIGQAKLRVRKAAYREDRISHLEHTELELTDAEKAELNGLLEKRESYEEQYNVDTFSEEHLEFKAMHNDVLIALANYCQGERTDDTPISVFFLDGPDGGTTSALMDRGGLDATQCYVANRHESSCRALRVSGGGRLPDENVIHATAAEALSLAAPIAIDGMDGRSAGKIDVDVATLQQAGPLADVPFAAYYFDGCGGFVPHIVGMMSSALIREQSNDMGPIAVGCSLLGGSKDVIDKELTICQALTIIAKRRGMRVVHALEDPSRYGISKDVRKIGGAGSGGTFTTWLLLEPDERLR